MREIVKAALLFTLFACISGSSTAQNKLRTIQEPAKFVYPNRPVEIISKSVADKPFLNEQIQAGSDWLHDFNITIRNISGKDIRWIETDLIIREEGPGRSRLVIPIYFGEGRGNTKAAAQNLLPAGQETTLKARQDDVDYWIRYCKTQGIEDIDKVIIDIRIIRFTDDTGWSLGSRTRKDPETGRYVFVTDNTEPPVRHPPTSLLIPEAPRFFF